MAEKQASPETQEQPGSGHEQNVVNVRAIARLGVGLFILTVMSFVLMVWMFDYLAIRQAKSDVPPSPLARPRQLPPQPRLQIAPSQALQALRAEQDAMLHTYSWVDREAGLVRIPIDRAIEVLAQRGLPVSGEERQTQ